MCWCRRYRVGITGPMLPLWVSQRVSPVEVLLQAVCAIRICSDNFTIGGFATPGAVRIGTAKYIAVGQRAVCRVCPC